MSLFTKGSNVRLVRARKDYNCSACNEILPKGHKYINHLCFDGKIIIRHTLCEPCYRKLIKKYGDLIAVL